MEYTINTIPKTSPAVNGIKENNVFKRGIQTADKNHSDTENPAICFFVFIFDFVAMITDYQIHFLFCPNQTSKYNKYAAQQYEKYTDNNEPNKITHLCLL